MRLLIVEDSRRLRETLTDGLRAGGYAVDAVGDGQDGYIHARTTDYDLIILDLMLPSLDGVSLLRLLRKHNTNTPVLILSARDRVEHRVEGLRAGGDDYLVKPFDFEELLARVEALTRRSRGEACNDIRLGPLTLDLSAKRFTIAGDELVLTPREFAVLEYLTVNAGRTLSRGELEEHVYPEDRQVWSNTIDSAIAAIRRKLGGAGIDSLIETRRGLGYMIARHAPGSGA